MPSESKPGNNITGVTVTVRNQTTIKSWNKFFERWRESRARQQERIAPVKQAEESWKEEAAKEVGA